MLKEADGTYHKEKRKLPHDSGAPESPRKRLLSDAFDNLSIINPHLKKHAREIYERNDARLNNDQPNANKFKSRTLSGEQSLEDVNMREPGAWSEDHTVYIDSLEDDLDPDPLDLVQAKFLFDMPGRIDTTFAGSKGIPPELLPQSSSTQANQMVLYRGPAQEIISRTMQNSLHQPTYQTGVNDLRVSFPDAQDIEADAMDLD